MDNSIYYAAWWLVAGGLIVGLMVLLTSLQGFQRHHLAHAQADEHPARQLYWLETGRTWVWAFILLLGGGSVWLMYQHHRRQQADMIAARQQVWPVFDPQHWWTAPDPYLAETDDHSQLIAYGRDLIAHTQDYFGPSGLVRPGTINALNCQSCHLDAGSKPFGNNYSAVYSTYPQMRARSASLETIPKRINDCFERSLNGQALDTTSREMRAMIAYMRWLGTGVPKGQKPKGVGLVEVPFLDRPADPAKGQKIYGEKCASCHGTDGQGLPMPEAARHYPPLWGDASYNEAAGLFRLSRLAGYVKANMPFGATHDNPQLSDEEAWDVSAYINSQPRPGHPFLATDWPKIDKKPYDHPFGPYADTFPEVQHKYGPFGPIVAYYKTK